MKLGFLDRRRWASGEAAEVARAEAAELARRSAASEAEIKGAVELMQARVADLRAAALPYLTGDLVDLGGPALVLGPARKGARVLPLEGGADDPVEIRCLWTAARDAGVDVAFFCAWCYERSVSAEARDLGGMGPYTDLYLAIQSQRWAFLADFVVECFKRGYEAGKVVPEVVKGIGRLALVELANDVPET